MATGKISKWVDEKGFGFIVDDEKQESFFLHHSKWQNRTIKPQVGMSVEFQGQQGQKGKEAVNARLLANKQPAPPQPHPTDNHQVVDTNQYPNPYHFISLKTANAVTDTPVWHDGKDSKDLLSGEMCFTLKPLTPLLVGQWQYKAEEVKNGRRENDNIHLPFFDSPVNEKKAILEPIRLTDGRVVLSGTSLKGMLRSSLSGLLSPPMERVAERSYSYRPNAQYQRNEDFRCVRPAIITAANPREIKVRVLSNATAVYFVRGNAEQSFKGIPIHERVAHVQGVTLDNNAGVRRHVVASNNASIGAGYYIRYDGGIDGTGELHHGIRGGVTYHHVWVEEREYNAGTTHTLPVDVISHYEKTLEHFLSDDGLFAAGYPNNEGKARTHIKAIQQRWQDNRSDLVGRLIYVELENGNINSFGHHYYYRWRYANTIRIIKSSTTVRPALAPLLSETVETDETKIPQPPSKLSAARLLFGYTSHRKRPIETRWCG